jgi:hypothetical protein
MKYQILKIWNTIEAARTGGAMISYKKTTNFI